MISFGSIFILEFAEEEFLFLRFTRFGKYLSEKYFNFQTMYSFETVKQNLHPN